MRETITRTRETRRLASPADQRVPHRVDGLDRYTLACQVEGCLRVLGFRACDPESEDDPAPGSYWFVWHGHVCDPCSKTPAFLEVMKREDVALDRAFREQKADLLSFLNLRRAVLEDRFTVDGPRSRDEVRLGLAGEAGSCYARLTLRFRTLADEAARGLVAPDRLARRLRRWTLRHESTCLRIARRLGVA